MPTASVELSTVITQVRIFEVTLVVPVKDMPVKFVVVLVEVSVIDRSSTLVFSPMVIIVTVPPGLLPARVSLQVCRDNPRREQPAGTVMPADSAYVPGIIQTVTPVSEFVFIYVIAASTVKNGRPLTAAVASTPFTESTTKTLPILGKAADDSIVLSAVGVTPETLP